MKRISAFLLFFVLALSLLPGCDEQKQNVYLPTGDDQVWGDTNATTPPAAEQKLSLPYFPDRGLNPYKTTDYVNQNLFSLIYQGLFAVDADYNVYPVLCKHYTMSKDMKTYTFYPQAATEASRTEKRNRSFRFICLDYLGLFVSLLPHKFTLFLREKGFGIGGKWTMTCENGGNMDAKHGKRRRFPDTKAQGRTA